MSRKSAIEKIETNLKEGLLFKVSTQLGSLIDQNPNDLSLRNRLAEIYFKSGFLDAAGKYWILIDSKETHVKECVEKYSKSVSYSANQILQDIKFKGDKNLVSEYARKKLIELEKESEQKTGYVPIYKSKLNQQKEPAKKTNPILEKLGCGIAISILILLIIIFGLGLERFFKSIF